MATKTIPAKTAGKTINPAKTAGKPQVSVYVLGASGAIALADAMDARKGARERVAAARKEFDEKVRPALEKAGMKFDTDTMEAARKAVQATVYRIYGVDPSTKDRTKPIPAGVAWGEFIGSVATALYPEWDAAKITALRDGDKADRDVAMKRIKRVITAAAPVKTGTKEKKTARELAADYAGRIAKDSADFTPQRVASIVQAFSDALKAAGKQPAGAAAPF